MFPVKLQVLGRRRVHTVSVVGASVAVASSAVDAPAVVLVKMELGVLVKMELGVLVKMELGVLVKMELEGVDMETVVLSVVDGSVVEIASLPVISGILGAESYVWHKNVSSQKCFVSFAFLGKVFEVFGHNQPCYVLRCRWLRV